MAVSGEIDAAVDGAGHPRAARVATFVAGAMLVPLALVWAFLTFFLGYNSIFLLALFGGYAIALAATSIGLMMPAPTPTRWFVLGIALPLLPLAVAALLRLVLGAPASDAGQADNSAELLVLPLVSAASGVALFLARRSRGSTSFIALGTLAILMKPRSRRGR